LKKKYFEIWKDRSGSERKYVFVQIISFLGLDV